MAKVNTENKAETQMKKNRVSSRKRGLLNDLVSLERILNTIA